jgi:hypothetical protein
LLTVDRLRLRPDYGSISDTRAETSMAQPIRSARAATAVARIERSRSATVWMAGMFLIVLAAAAGLVLLANEKNMRAADRKAADAVTQHQTASIVLNQDDPKSCQVKSFDNRTGQISAANTPCPDGGLTEATGSSTGQGTAHTINAISKSFRSQ